MVFSGERLEKRVEYFEAEMEYLLAESNKRLHVRIVCSPSRATEFRCKSVKSSGMSQIPPLSDNAYDNRKPSR